MKTQQSDPKATRRRWPPEYPAAVVDFAKRQARPRRDAYCGVYFLFNDDKLVYVGSTINLAARLVGSDHAAKAWDSYVFLPCPPSERLAKERSCIKTFLPPMNNCSIARYLRRVRGEPSAKRPRPKLSVETMRRVREFRNHRHAFD